MIVLSATDEYVLLKFQSDITFVDVAVEIIRNVLEYLAVEDPTNVLLVSRELLKNAVVHGNQNDRDKEVVLRLFRIAQDRFRLEVEDSGQGIGLRNIQTTMLEQEQPDRRGEKSGHGLTIINRLSEQVFFNETGNIITVLLGA